MSGTDWQTKAAAKSRMICAVSGTSIEAALAAERARLTRREEAAKRKAQEVRP